MRCSLSGKIKSVSTWLMDVRSKVVNFTVRVFQDRNTLPYIAIRRIALKWRNPSLTFLVAFANITESKIITNF
jgi:hypothetical protein